MATISEALAIAIRHHQAGRLQAAERIYRQILQVEPNQAEAIHFLGVIAAQSGKHAAARPIFSTSVGRWKHYEQALGPLLARLEGRKSLY